MKCTLSSLLLGVTTLSNLVYAGDHTVWYTTTCWETSYPEKQQPSTYWSTVYVPTETTVYKTVPTTIYQTVPTTIYETVPTTIYETTTDYENVPTTVYNNVPTTIYQNVPTTVYQNVPTTVYVTEVNQQTVVSSNVVYNTVTQVQATTVSISAVCPTSSSLSGLVLCPSRIINPTYTPATPLPSNYIWGCPPGSICQPTQENCNFEQNTPADTYLCPPEQCQIAGPLPSLEEVLAEIDGGPDCAWLTPPPGYFVVDPRPFGYTYSIFNIFGQPQCPANCPAPSTVTVTETAQASAPPPATITVTVTITVSAPVVVSPPPSSKSYPSSSTWQTWSEPAKQSATSWAQWSSEVSTTSSDWQGWQKGSATNSWGSHVTPRAVLDPRVVYYPMPCYSLIIYAGDIFQSIGSDSVRLCPSTGPFSVAYRTALACYSTHPGVMPSAVATHLEEAVTYCANNPLPSAKKREADMHFSPRRNRRVQNGAL